MVFCIFIINQVFSWCLNKIRNSLQVQRTRYWGLYLSFEVVSRISCLSTLILTLILLMPSTTILLFYCDLKIYCIGWVKISEWSSTLGQLWPHQYYKVGYIYWYFLFQFGKPSTMLSIRSKGKVNWVYFLLLGKYFSILFFLLFELWRMFIHWKRDKGEKCKIVPYFLQAYTVILCLYQRESVMVAYVVE